MRSEAVRDAALWERHVTLRALVDVLVDTRKLLARPGNDFSWSQWNDGAEAVAEIDETLARIEAAGLIEIMPLKTLFGPTGSIQDVSIDSGWGDEFLELAARFDAASADV